MIDHTERAHTGSRSVADSRLEPGAKHGRTQGTTTPNSFLQAVQAQLCPMLAASYTSLGGVSLG